jgi:ubiquinone/menaquinone biosynthesis C-methylase UbiE
MIKENLDFIGVKFFLGIRDLLIPREKVLAEVDIKPGFSILDYGCGPGTYSIIAAKSVGENGKVYSLDVNPFALTNVKKRAERLGLKNIETINTGYKTNLKDKSIDVVFLYDIFHELKEPRKILEEIHRVLKPKGILSFSDHHLNEREIISGVEGSSFFKLLCVGKKTYSFLKAR